MIERLLHTLEGVGHYRINWLLEEEPTPFTAVIDSAPVCIV
jgi:hypothetical protein